MGQLPLEPWGTRYSRLAKVQYVGRTDTFWHTRSHELTSQRVRHFVGDCGRLLQHRSRHDLSSPR